VEPASSVAKRSKLSWRFRPVLLVNPAPKELKVQMFSKQSRRHFICRRRRPTVYRPTFFVPPRPPTIPNTQDKHPRTPALANARAMRNRRDAGAISTSLFLIVMVSVMLGSALPFGFARAGVDPAHAGTTIQVPAGRSPSRGGG